jgi:hypothetical protein
MKHFFVLGAKYQLFSKTFGWVGGGRNSEYEDSVQADAGGIMFQAMNKLFLVGMQLTEKFKENIYNKIYWLYLLQFSVYLY